jgi:hypothetical protein
VLDADAEATALAAIDADDLDRFIQVLECGSAALRHRTNHEHYQCNSL